jgi:hypothetical protein
VDGAVSADLTGGDVRYLEGSVELGNKDRQLLEIVAITNRITQLQLWEIAKLKGIESDRKVFEWRVRRLATGGFLRRDRQPFLGSRVLYSITENGICGLEMGGVYLLSVYVERKDDEVERQVMHALQLNRAHIALLNTGALQRWTPAKDLAIINRAGYRSYAKTYDAVATISVDRESFEIGIEYERSLKSADKYEELRSKLESEDRADAILYLFSKAEIGTKLQWAFRNSQKDIVIAHHEQFVASPLEAPAVCRILQTTLCDVLRSVAMHRKTVARNQYSGASTSRS